MIRLRNMLGIATATALGATVLAGPAAADDVLQWTSSNYLNNSQAGIALGNVAFTSASDTFAAWTLTSGVNYQPQVTRGTKGASTTWPLDEATATQSQTQLAMAKDGSTGFAVYKKLVGGVGKLFWSRWNGTSWSGGTELATSVNLATPPAVDIRRDGTFGVVVWKTSANGTQAARFNGTTFATPESLDASTTGGTLSAAVATGANRALVSWISTSAQLRSRAWTGNGWAPARDVSQNVGASTAGAGVVDLSADGTRSVAVWAMNTGAETARAAVGNGDTWATPTTLGTTVANIQDMDVALNADGSRAWAAWGYDTAAAGSSVYLNRAQLESGSWSSPTIADGPKSDDTRPDPDVGISDSGLRATLAYRGKQDSANFVGYVQVLSRGSWGSGVPVGTFEGNSVSGFTRMALSPNGTLGSAVSVENTGGQQVLARRAMTILTAPDAPSAPVAEQLSTPLGNIVRLSWTPAEFIGNFDYPSFSVESDPPGPVCPTDGYSCVVQGMTPGITYRFRAFATAYYGVSEPSPWSEPVTLPLPPGDPVSPGDTSLATPKISKLTVKQGRSAKGMRKVQVRWTTTAPATSYQIRVSKPGGKKWKPWRTVTRPKAILRLKRAKKYRIAVKAQQAQVTSPAKIVRFRVKR